MDCAAGVLRFHRHCKETGKRKECTILFFHAVKDQYFVTNSLFFFLFFFLGGGVKGLKGVLIYKLYT